MTFKYACLVISLLIGVTPLLMSGDTEPAYPSLDLLLLLLVTVGLTLGYLYYKYTRLQSKIQLISRSIRHKYEVIATGGIRFSLSFRHTLKDLTPGVLAYSPVYGYQLFAWINNEIKARNINQATLKTCFSPVPQDTVKYMEYKTREEKVYFAPQVGMFLFGQHNHTDAIVKKVEQSRKTR